MIKLETHESGKPPEKKRRRWGRKLSGVVSIVLHQTAVFGGFGTTARQRRIATPIRDIRDGHTTARVHRYRRTPYHVVLSPEDDLTVFQWAPKWHTFHGNRSNKYSIGWAWDGLDVPGKPGDIVDTGQVIDSLVWTIERARDMGAPIRFIEAHRQHDDDRELDPGQAIMQAATQVIGLVPFLSFRPEHTTGDGLELPKDWT